MDLSQVGRFRILGKIGQGAMGEVFRAHDPVLGRDVAIKVVKGQLSEDEEARQRFLREAQSAAQLNHPNVITIHDFGEEQSVAYMAMELLEGDDLRELIVRQRAMSLEQKLVIMEQILDGLAFAHSKGVVHRDLKPGNVRVLPSGQVKIMDFGLARRTEDGATTGVVLGTPHYMAPEQARGDPASVRSDIFSVGALFYELLTGKRPFTGPTIIAVLYGVVHNDPPLIRSLAPDVPPGLAAVVMRALAKPSEARYADGGEMLKALRLAWVEGGVEGTGPHGDDAPADLTPARELGPPLSSAPGLTAELRAALNEIEQYLADRVPPLMVADSVAILVEAPVEGSASELLDWAQRQRAAQPELPLPDLLFHAVHKLSVIGEFHLVDEEPLLGFLRSVGAVLAEACLPGDERDSFRRALRHVGESEMVRTGPMEMMRASEPSEVELTAAPAGPGLRRLTLLEQRLRREVWGPSAERARRRLVSQAITVAATEARNEREFEEHLRRLRSAGVASGADQVFRSLGNELTDWALPKNTLSDTLELSLPREVQAMQKIVSLPEDPIEVAQRYRHLVSAATEQFNQGNLGAAAQMFDLAAELSAGTRIAPGFVEPILKKGHEALDERQLHLYTDEPERHGQLQAVMSFFEPGLGPATLLDQLENEAHRGRRRMLLDLLTIHGSRGRAAARERLEASLRTEASDFSRRNWIYLLRLVPRPEEESPESEIAAVARFATPGNPAFLVKEALTHLGQTHHPRMAEALVSLLGAWETEAERGNLGDQAHAEALTSLDRVASALARQGGPGGWSALLDHGLSGWPDLGNAAARLAELGSQDLSSASDVVETLMAEIEGSLPRGVLGRLVRRKDKDLPALVTALASTHTPAVRALLQQVRERFEGQEAGRAAARALEVSSPVAATVAAGQSGKLSAYGLPSLLHRFAEAKATGVLKLLPEEGGAAPATIGFRQGRPVSARREHREGSDAVYQLFERPFSGQFAFDAQAAPPGGAPSLPEFGSLLREGLRRASELRRTSAIVPEELPLEATGQAPGTVADEPDHDLVVALWEKACAGMPAQQVEATVAADAFRIYRPLAQWLEEGSLRVVAPAPE
jgi:serine/threonine protein kinase